MKKKMMSLALALVMCMTLCVPALAHDNTETSKSDNSVTLKSVGHGEFTLDSYTGKGLVAGQQAAHAEYDDTVIAQPTNDSDILKVSDTKYLVQATDTSYILTDKISISINNFEDTLDMLYEHGVSERSIQSMRQTIVDQQGLGNNDLAIDVYVPSEMSSGDATSRSTTSTSYYTYKDSTGYTWKLKDINIQYTNLSSPMVEENGTGVLNKAKGFVNLVITAVGTISKTVSAFGTGQSLYDAYVAIRGPVVSTSGSDRTYSLVVFDRTEKESQVFAEVPNSYIAGKVSHKALVRRMDTYQYYAATGYSELIKPSINKEHYTRYWNNNEMTVSRTGWEDYISIKLYDTKVLLNGTR